MDQVKFFKGCFPQFLLGPFLNTWFQMALVFGDADSESNGYIYFTKTQKLFKYKR